MQELCFFCRNKEKKPTEEVRIHNAIYSVCKECCQMVQEELSCVRVVSNAN